MVNVAAAVIVFSISTNVRGKHVAFLFGCVRTLNILDILQVRETVDGNPFSSDNKSCFIERMTIHSYVGVLYIGIKNFKTVKCVPKRPRLKKSRKYFKYEL